MAFIRRNLYSVVALSIVAVVALAAGGLAVLQNHRAEDRASKGEAVCAVYEGAKDIPSLAGNIYTAVARDLCFKYRAGD